MWVKRLPWQEQTPAPKYVLYLADRHTQPGRQSSNCRRRIPNQIKPQMFCQTDRAVKRLDCAWARPKPVPGVDPAPVSVPVPVPVPVPGCSCSCKLGYPEPATTTTTFNVLMNPKDFTRQGLFSHSKYLAAKREEGEEETEGGKERERLAFLCFDTRLQSI